MRDDRIKFVTKIERIKNVAKRWKNQYYANNGGSFAHWYTGLKSEEIYHKLTAEENLTEKKITEIIGNDTWTQIRCDLCQKSVDVAVEINELCVCEHCLDKISYTLSEIGNIVQ